MQNKISLGHQQDLACNETCLVPVSEESSEANNIHIANANRT